MRQLILMRHAKSSWDNPGIDDFDRPLNARGRKTAPLMGQHLRDNQIAVDVILASTAKRVQQTLEGVRPAWKTSAIVLNEKQLYLPTLETLQSVVTGLHDSWSCAMLIGHNPGLSELASIGSNSEIYLTTGAVVIFEVNAPSWLRACTSLPWTQRALWKPKELFQMDE